MSEHLFSGILQLPESTSYFKTKVQLSKNYKNLPDTL